MTDYWGPFAMTHKLLNDRWYEGFDWKGHTVKGSQDFILAGAGFNFAACTSRLLREESFRDAEKKALRQTR